ncbi:ThiJ/PfpI [Vibrio ichthyoenteri ATCC 700023]|uniref:ThiJ/PfpI n=1 Tax=Vibrio ichthyoenteri ATCC 700023 TaxID=870968 RepID=F9S739_9VIBR|nr:nucleoside hydrolase [Vibrio ichthyoenteri]EGU32019.1 ThiJ/PfpI [Vibrio ichthyoenteri ATCC 700023]
MDSTQGLNNSRNVKKALLIVTSHTELGDTGKKTGFWFDELATPFWGFYDAGYEVTIASIKGGKALPDPLSAQGEFVSPAVDRFMQSTIAMNQLDNTPSVDTIRTGRFTTLFLCGGHGTLWDFKQSNGLARIVSEFYADKKLIGSVCHGPTGFLSAKKPDGSAFANGLKLTSFTDAEEQLTPPEYLQALPYHIEDELIKVGAKFEAKQPNASFVVCEDGLITGQNPASVKLVTKTILDTLNKQRVWIDTDLSIGASSSTGTPCDVDDAFALLSLFNASNIKVSGMSSVFGNTDTDTAFTLSKMLSNRFGPISLPVVKGAQEAININNIQPNDATDALAKALKAGPLTIAAIGPATNIAALILLHPELVERIEQIVLVAGRSSESTHFIAGPKQTTPFRDLNFDLDPNALHILLESQIPLVFTPFELANKVWITSKELDVLKSNPGVGQYLNKHSQPWLEMWSKDFGAKGFNPFDALAAGYIINPNRYHSKQVSVELRIGQDDTKSSQFGQSNHYKPYLIASDEAQGRYSALVCTDVDSDFAESLINSIVSPNDPAKYITSVSHLNIVVDDIEKATAFYKRTLGFEQAFDEDGAIMDYPHLALTSFAKDAGFSEGKVDVDIRFLHHPNAGLYLELMCYHTPQGDQNITVKNTNDMGGIRHTALEVNDIMTAFNYLKDQPGVEIVRYPDGHKDDAVTQPMLLSPFPMSFFYWRDQYGVQWEMECGRQRGSLRGI